MSANIEVINHLTIFIVEKENLFIVVSQGRDRPVGERYSKGNFSFT